MTDRFAKTLDHTLLHGDSSFTQGLKKTWARPMRVEAIVHDVAHMVVLGKPIENPQSLARKVNNETLALPYRSRQRNEILTLAIEVLFFRRHNVFTPADHKLGSGETRWLESVTGSLPKVITPGSVLRATKTSDVVRLTGLLDRRLRYHCKYSLNRVSVRRARVAAALLYAEQP